MTYIDDKVQGPHLEWTINRPSRQNAIGPTIANNLLAMVQDLEKKLSITNRARSLNKDPILRSLTIKTNPVQNKEQKTWCAGGDLTELANLKSKRAVQGFALLMIKVCSKIEHLPIPVLIAIDGDVYGGGIEFALCGDLRLATNSSRFFFKQLDIGLPTGFGGTSRLVSLIGMANAQRILFESQTMNADLAKTVGVIHEVFESPQKLATKITEHQKRIETLSPEAVAAQKKMFAKFCPSMQTYKKEIELFARVWRNPKHQKFLNEFASKCK